MTRPLTSAEMIDDVSRTSSRRAWKRALLATELVAAYVIVRLGAVGGPGAFPAAGNVYVGPGHPSELKVLSGSGYDGQFVYRLAIEPFTTHVTGHGITFDSPAYRQQRIMTALLARIVSDLPGVSTALALIIVNSFALVVAMVAGMALADDLGVSQRMGVLVALPAGVITGFVADLTEPVAWAAVLVGIVAARRQRWLTASAAFGIAMLARETTAIVVFGYLVESAVFMLRGGARGHLRRAWLLAPVVVETAWQVWLWHVWGRLPAITGLRSLGVHATFTSSSSARGEQVSGHLPFVGIWQTFLDGLVTGDTPSVLLGISYLFERLVLLGLIGVAAWVLVRRHCVPGIGLTVAWCVAVAISLTLTSWRNDIQFLRAALEAWGLSILLLVQVRAYPARWALGGAAAAAIWVAVYFLPRV